MSYKVFSIPPFDKQLKRLAKKYPSLKREYRELIEILEHDPMQGTSLGNNAYKIRLAIASKGKGEFEKQRIYIRHVFTHADYDRNNWRT